MAIPWLRPLALLLLRLWVSLGLGQEQGRWAVPLLLVLLQVRVLLLPLLVAVVWACLAAPVG